MRCSACQATLPEGAQWCGQCFAPAGNAAPSIPAPQWASAQAPAAPSTPATFGQSPYGQAAPSYGQTPPAYGEVPPMYGQPAPAYGQTVPAQSPYSQAPYGQAPANPYAQQGFAPPGYGQPFPPQSAANPKKRPLWIAVAAIVVLLFASAGWVANHRPGPLLTVADVQMRTPVGWKSSSRGSGAAFLEGMAQAMKVDPSTLQAQAAEHGRNGIAAVATMQVPTVVSADVLLAGIQRMDPQAQAQAGLSDATSITVGHRAAVEVTVSRDSLSGKMVFVPEGHTWVLCIVGTVGGGAPNGDTTWIIQHLTTK